jgi:hypothetical protein
MRANDKSSEFCTFSQPGYPKANVLILHCFQGGLWTLNGFLNFLFSPRNIDSAQILQEHSLRPVLKTILVKSDIPSNMGQFANCSPRLVSHSERCSSQCATEMLRRNQVYMMCALYSVLSLNSIASGLCSWGKGRLSSPLPLSLSSGVTNGGQIQARRCQ